MSRAYRFILEGSQQVPGVVSSASGLGTAVFDSATNSLLYTMQVTGLDWGPFLGQAAETPAAGDNVNNAHFHSGARGANGGVIFDWLAHDADDFTGSAPASGTRTISGRWETTDPVSIAGFSATFANGVLGADIGVYANIHTVANGGGELRGQLVTIATDASETVTGTAGNDYLPGLGGDDTIEAGAGNDTIDGGAGTDTLFGGAGNDRIDAGPFGPADAGYMYGGEGNDTITSSAGFAVIYGDGANSATSSGSTPGNDSIDVSGTTAGSVYVYAGGGQDTVTGASGVADASNSFYYYGEAGTDSISGGAGDEVLDGGEGNDTLDGGAGRDNIYGGEGNDSLRSGGSNVAGLLERMYGGDGNDTLIMTASNYQSVWGDFENAAAVPGSAPGDDLIDLTAAGANTGFFVNVWGGGGGDTVQGSAGLDYIYGEDGNDSLNAGAGDDPVYGGNGNDTIDGGAGRDLIEASYDNDSVSGGNEVGAGDTIYGGANNDTINGNDGDDYLYGEHGADSLNGGAGVDVLFVDSSDVFYDGGAGIDYIVWQDASVAANVNVAAHSADYFYGYDGADVAFGLGATARTELHGGNGNDTLVGSAGVGAILLGENGDDRLVSETGTDLMVGGDGADTFVFGANGGVDFVYDFKTGGADKADFTALAGAGVHSLADMTVITIYGAGSGWWGYQHATGTVWLNTAPGNVQPIAGDFMFV